MDPNLTSIFQVAMYSLRMMSAYTSVKLLNFVRQNEYKTFVHHVHTQQLIIVSRSFWPIAF